MLLTVAEIVSLVLTGPTLYLCYVTFKDFWPRAKAAIFIRYRTPMCWLALGVAVSFGGQFGDNFSWGIAWAADYSQSPLRDWLFKHGVLSNIPFRQTAGILGAYCHIRGLIEMSKINNASHRPVEGLHRNILISVLVSALVVGLLTVYRYNHV